MPLISEIRPNPAGTDPATQTVEISGTPGQSFSGFLVSIESDAGSSAGTVDRVASITGTFDASGLLTASIPDLENPSFTLVLTDTDPGIGNTIDADADGTLDNTAILGTIYDAVGVPDTTGAPLYGMALGGVDLGYIGSEPELIFRDASTGDFFQVDFNGDVFDQSGTLYTGDTTGFTADTFGSVNPSTASGAFDLEITEIWPGQDGTDVTEDWFEITNTGTADYDAALHGALSYDDESEDPADATPIEGFTTLAAGQRAVVVIGDAAAAAEFEAVWGEVIDLTGVKIGYADGAGLGQGGDAVSLFVDARGDGVEAGDVVDFEAYPEANAVSGRSYDVDAAAFSEAGVDGAVATDVLGGAADDEPAVGSPGDGAPIGGGGFVLEILHVTDQEWSTGDIQNAANASGILNAFEAQDLGGDGEADNTLRLSSGDAFIPGVYAGASEAVFGLVGLGDFQIQNERGFDAIALGNHEFDFGTATLAELIAPAGTYAFDQPEFDGTDLDDATYGGTEYPYLSTNLDFSTDPDMAPLEVVGGQAPAGNVVTSSIVADVNGEMIGIVGATTPKLGSISSPGSIGISPEWAGSEPTAAELDALAEVIQVEVDALLAANATMNKVVLLTHMQQISIELALAERLSNVDVIIAGGSNTRLFDDNDVPRAGDSDQGQYPTFVTDADGNATAIVNTDGGYKYVGRLVIEFDDEGHIISGSYDETLSGAYATDETGLAAVDGAQGLIDAEVQAITDDIEAQVIATESNVFGISEVFLNGNRSGTFDAEETDGVRVQETNLGNLTADANLAYAEELTGSDIVLSIKNGGGIRASIGETVVPAGGSDFVRLPNAELVDGDGNVIKPEGGISQNDIATALAFNNNLVVLTLTASEIVALLEHGVSAYPDVAGQFPQISGIEFSYDPDLVAGSRIVDAALVDEEGEVLSVLVEGGETQSPGATFDVVTLGFLAEPRFDASGEFIGGGDGYPFPNLNDDPAAGELGDAAVIARVNLRSLDDGSFTEADSAGDFAATGTEQDALAEYLDENFDPNNGGTAYADHDTAFTNDGRIQNLDFREGDVLPEGTAPEAPEATDDFEAITIAAVFDSLVGEGGSEVVVHENGLLYVTNGETGAIDVWDIASETLARSYDLTALPDFDGVQSAAVKNGLIAAAVATPDQTVGSDVVGNNGYIALIDDATQTVINRVEVGNLPDMVTFSPDGTKILVANEGEFSGESDLPVDPVGAVSIIDVTDPSSPIVLTAGFEAYNGMEAMARAEGIRIPDYATFAEAMEPEYIAVEGDTAYITLQEANAFATLDLTTGEFTAVNSFGTVDHSLEGNELDVDDDGVIDIEPHDVRGLRMPDALDTFVKDGATYLITANEGDGRGDPTDDLDDVPFPARADEARVGNIVDGEIEGVSIDPDAYTAEELDALSRLTVSLIDGDTDGDGDIDVLHSFGSRSFTIFDTDGNVVFDSGSEFEAIIADLAAYRFNNDDGEPIASEDDNRSDAKGPEPEAVTVGEVDGELYAFIGLERDSGVMIYNIDDPANASFVNYIPGFMNELGESTDDFVGPETIAFIAADESTTGNAQIAVAYEISGDTVVYDLSPYIPDLTLVSEVQGEGLASPLVDQEVTIEVIVTGDFQNGDADTTRDLGGFYVQEEMADYDGNDATSEGLFVYDASFIDAMDLEVGDKVRITGTVTEYFGLTELTDLTNIKVLSSGNALPDAVTIDLSAGADLEARESMLVEFANDMVITEQYNLDRFGEAVLFDATDFEQAGPDGTTITGERPFTYTQYNAPDAAGLTAYEAEVDSRSIVYDDGVSGSLNPVTLWGDGYTTETAPRMGDTVSNLSGVLSYGFDAWRVQSTVDGENEVTNTNPRPEIPAAAQEGELKVASFNVLNFFTTIDPVDPDGDDSYQEPAAVGPGADQEPRGADDRVTGDGVSEFDRQLEKAVTAIMGLGADIVGLNEIENDFLAGGVAPADGSLSEGAVAVATLVDALNAKAGTTAWAYVDPGVEFVGDDAIANAIIYRTDRVSLVEGSVDVLTDAGVDPGLLKMSTVDNSGTGAGSLFNGPNTSRAPITATFETQYGEEISVVVNHLKSKGGSGTGGDADAADGAGSYNALRALSAQAVADWIAAKQADGTMDDENVILVGDLNSYQAEDPIDVLEAAGFLNVAAELLDTAYSYVFDALIGTLDYAFVAETLFDAVIDVLEWHINADEADAIDYNLDSNYSENDRDPAMFDGDTVFRASDHDPIVVSIDFTDGSFGIDSLVGNAEDETFTFRAGQLGEGNSVDGGDGVDGLKLIGGGTFDLRGVELESVEFIEVAEAEDDVIIKVPGQSDTISLVTDLQSAGDGENITIDLGSGRFAKAIAAQMLNANDFGDISWIGKAGEAVMTDDDAAGTLTTVYTDASGERAYETVTDVVDASSGLFLSRLRENHNGTTDLREFDESGTIATRTITDVEDVKAAALAVVSYEEGVRTQSIVEYDNGITATTLFAEDGRFAVSKVQSDPLDEFRWTTRTMLFDDDGVRTEATIEYDDGTTTTIVFDDGGVPELFV